MSSSERVTGTVGWFNAAKGYGFLRLPGETEAGIFVHYSAIQADGYRLLHEGEPVEFEMTDGPKGRMAINVHPTSRVRAGK